MFKNAVCPGIWLALDVGGPEIQPLSHQSVHGVPSEEQPLDQIGLRERNTGPRFPLETASVRCICEDVQIVLF